MDIIKSLNDAKLSHYDIWKIVGDFNLPDVTYIFPFTRCRDLTYNMFFGFFSDNLLHQLVQAPTRGNAILDLVWTNGMNMIDNVEVTSPIANSDHNTIIITLTGGCSESGKTEPAQQKKNRHLDIAAAAVILRNTDWHSLLSGKNDVDEMVTSFMAVIDNAIPFIQRQGMAKHNKGQSTLPKHIRKLIHKKRKLWKRLQRYPPTDPLTDYKFSDFAAARKAVKKAIYGFRCDELNKLTDCKNKKQFYRYINRHVKTKSSIH